ncbi:hypothetical protein HC251_14190 [Iamia sp. SCSIO 61187]|uniref:hypothetical protein n=1 Tax=Iamia sp. SCSIO 61187 TaxID=2722752 RepID=UPI001C62C7E0|nr:hypothetical protein [Iamia sp. SCSIO 61187]QYG93458.1 hypothetical protein HC251_14190 [Iamia sp. SCSIO 61187]
MADATEADDATKAAAEGLKKILEVLAPEPTPVEEPKVTAPVDEVYGAIGAADVSSSAMSAMGAVERYRNAMRWLIGAVGAIGLALFGSVAFTKGDPLADRRWVGLAVAGTGLTFMLRAATLVFEPEDASLGELEADFDRLNGPLGWFRSRIGRGRAMRHLKKMLTGTEASAHLGPEVESVSELIKEIAALEKGRNEFVGCVVDARRTLDDATSRRSTAENQISALVTTRSAATSLSDEAAKAIDTAIEAASRGAIAARQDEDDARNALRDALRALEEKDIPLGRHMLHRSVVLDESGVAQMRGTFRAARSTLLLGSVATLVGTLLYLAGIKGAPDNLLASTVRFGSIEVGDGMVTAEELDEECVDQELEVAYFGDRPGAGDDYAISVVAPKECEGVYTVEGDDEIELDLSRAIAVPKTDDAGVRPEKADDGASDGAG